MLIGMFVGGIEILELGGFPETGVSRLSRFL